MWCRTRASRRRFGLLLEAQAQRKRGQKIKEKQNVKEVFDGMKSWFAKNF